MYCYRNVTDDLYWVGGNDRRLSLFEGVYQVPRGVSYNSYLLIDEKTVLFDTVDRAVADVFFENLEALLGERQLDYIVVHHMEPDHSATLLRLTQVYPEVTVVCNAKISAMMNQFFPGKSFGKIQLVKEGDHLSSGKHEFQFVFAPFVHWPEVMMSYDISSHILFSADAFGTFGALDGALFADEVDFEKDWLGEARRYYSNIVGKYGNQVQTALKKASALEIGMICPLHGFVWREDIAWYLDKYEKWSTYTPEEAGVVIAYASVYGHTANAADLLAVRLRERGIRTVVYDVSMTKDSDVIAAIFRYSHVVFASTTYNSGIFVRMEELLRDLSAHGIQKRTAAFMENGSWGITAAKQMKAILEGCKEMEFIEKTVSMKSALTTAQAAQIDELAEEIARSVENR